MIATLLAALLAAASPPVKIATLQLEGAGVSPELVASATVLVPTEIRRARPEAQVISAEDVRLLLSHQKDQLVLGCGADAACLKDLGGLLGVDEIVGGRLGRLGETWVLELRRLDVKLGKNLASATRAVGSAEALVGAVRSAAGELYTAGLAMPGGVGVVSGVPPVVAGGAGGSGGAGAGGPVVPLAPRSPDDRSLPIPSLGKGEFELLPIPYRGTRNRAIYDVVRAVLAEARIPVEKERLDDDDSLSLRTDWVVVEQGRHFRFRARVDGQVALELDRERCGEQGCAETWDVSDRERQFATAVAAAVRARVAAVK